MSCLAQDLHLLNDDIVFDGTVVAGYNMLY